MPLARLQSELIAAILNRIEPDGNFVRRIHPGGALTHDSALGVYRRAYAARLSDALAETYEAVHWILGHEKFARHAKSYIRNHPSRSYNLGDYGGGFDSHLARAPEIAEFPFLDELARFEWDFKNLFHEPDAAANFPDASSGAAVLFSRSTRLKSHGRAVYEIWKRRGTDFSQMDPDWTRPERLFLFKDSGDVRAARLQEAEYETVAALYGGADLDGALERAAARFPEFGPERVSDLFRMLGASGAVRFDSTGDPQKDA